MRKYKMKSSVKSHGVPTYGTYVSNDRKNYGSKSDYKSYKKSTTRGLLSRLFRRND